jgi:hypothetical protein
MNNSILKISLAAILVSMIFVSCIKNEKARPAPTISFVEKQNFVSGDTTLCAGEKILTSISCRGNGTDGLYAVQIYRSDTSMTLYISYGYTQVTIDSISIIKSGSASDQWFFEVTDSQGEKGSISYTLTLNTSGGTIVHSSATIGAQGNTTNYGYYSLKTNLNYNATDANTNQNIIDLLGAYDATNGIYLASPSSPNLPDTYPTELSSWTKPIDSTKFTATSIAPSQFDLINRDNLLISSFSTNPINQKNKAKNLKVNDIYAFKLTDKRYGLFKVTAVTTGATGSVSIDVKIQHP